MSKTVKETKTRAVLIDYRCKVRKQKRAACLLDDMNIQLPLICDQRFEQIAKIC